MTEATDDIEDAVDNVDGFVGPDADADPVEGTGGTDDVTVTGVATTGIMFLYVSVSRPFMASFHRNIVSIRSRLLRCRVGELAASSPDVTSKRPRRPRSMVPLALLLLAPAPAPEMAPVKGPAPATAPALLGPADPRLIIESWDPVVWIANRDRRSPLAESTDADGMCPNVEVTLGGPGSGGNCWFNGCAGPSKIVAGVITIPWSAMFERDRFSLDVRWCCWPILTDRSNGAPPIVDCDASRILRLELRSKLVTVVDSSMNRPFLISLPPAGFVATKRGLDGSTGCWSTDCVVAGVVGSAIVATTGLAATV